MIIFQPLKFNYTSLVNGDGMNISCYRDHDTLLRTCIPLSSVSSQELN